MTAAGAPPFHVTPAEMHAVATRSDAQTVSLAQGPGAGEILTAVAIILIILIIGMWLRQLFDPER